VPDPIRINSKDLFSEDVESYLETQEYLRRDVGELEGQSWIGKVIFSSWFYLSMCSALGAFVGWIILEPFYSDNDDSSLGLLWFPMVTGLVGLFLGAAEGIMCRNPMRALVSGAVGLGVGFAGACILLIPTTILYIITSSIAESLRHDDGDGMPTGVALLVHMFGRAMAWALVSIPAGIGQGIALRERKIVFNGLVGAVLGGMLGGMLFDPISMLPLSDDGEAAYSRGIGFVCIGLLVGLFVGLVEGWTKTAWLIMRKGPLAGKQFILFKDTTTLGSSPKAEIYLFKDEAIEPKHAVIYNRGGRFEIEDKKTPDGTYVNGIPVQRTMLQHGDQIVMGKTVLEFALKEARN
jgi:hypothetical protein